jgi:hypothetical protein
VTKPQAFFSFEFLTGERSMMELTTCSKTIGLAAWVGIICADQSRPYEPPTRLSFR